MRIAIDARELAGQPTGVGRYLAEILREWGDMPAAQRHDYVLCAPAPVPYSGALRAATAVARGAGTWWEQRELPRLARDADVLFCPAYSGPVFDTTPLVVAIHDVSFAAHPEWFGWREGLRRRLVTRASARRAARVLTLTEFSKREIVGHLGVPPEHVDVVHPGVVAHPFNAPRNRRDEGCGPEAPRGVVADALVLYVGSLFTRRHVPETIRGFERLARARPEVRLAIVGDNRTVPRVDFEPFVRDRARVRLHSYVSDQVLGGMYRTARAFVFLSEYEGFGLTPLEALAAGIPIVVLDTEVAREVFGEAAVYVRSPQPDEIAAALELALFDEDVRTQVMTAAASVLPGYSWTRCARKVLAALERAGACRRSSGVPPNAERR